MSIKITTKQFIKKAKKIHGYKYDYSLVKYLKTDTKVKISCEFHGFFMQTPNNHLSGQGCPNCGIENKIKSLLSNTKEFIVKAKKIHNDKYSYYLSKYKDNKTKVKIYCSEHGVFKQEPSNHLFGQGCPKCKPHYSKPEIQWLNSLKLPNNDKHRQVTLKIGNKLIKVDGFNPKTNTVYEFHGDFWHGNPIKFKSKDIHPITKKTYGKLYQETKQRQKLIRDAGYNLVEMWESNWNQLK